MQAIRKKFSPLPREISSHDVSELANSWFVEMPHAYKASLLNTYAAVKKDGEIRLLKESDLAAIQRHLCELSSDDRVLRFSADLSDAKLCEYARSLNFHRDIVVGAHVAGRLEGLCHLAVFDRKGYPVGELGLSVARKFRRSGLGKRMLDLGFVLAAEAGITRAFIYFLRRNAGMSSLVKRLGAEVDTDGTDSTACIQVARALEYTRVTRRLTSNGVEVFEAGPADATKTVMLVHGAGGDSWQWRQKLQPYLAAQGIRSFAVSLSNHGASRRTDRATVDTYLDDLREAVELCGVPNTLVGHSLGGYISQKFAERFVVDHLVLVGSVPPEGLADLELESAKIALGNGHARKVLASAMKASRAAAARPIAKVVTVMGGEHDQVIPPEIVKRTADFFGVKATMVPGGHLLMLGQSWEDVAQAVVG